MIPLILLHIALTAQVESRFVAINPSDLPCVLAGPEHTIEIRTKREEAHPQCPDSWANFAETAKACKCPVNYTVVIDGNPEPATSTASGWASLRRLKRNERPRTVSCDICTTRMPDGMAAGDSSERDKDT